MEAKPEYRVEMLTGTSELKTWFEADLQPDGSVVLSGRSCRIDRRMDGSIRNVKFDNTGCTLKIHNRSERESVFTMLRRRLWPNDAVKPRSEAESA